MSKKITISSLRKAIDANTTETTEIEWGGVNISVKNLLPWSEFKTLISNIVEACFDDESGEYDASMVDPAMRLGVLEMYTNLPMSTDGNENYKIAYCPGLYDKVVHAINEGQYFALHSATADEIKRRVDVNKNMIERKVDEAYTMISAMQEQLKDIFGGIEGGDMAKMLNAIADGRFDEQKLAKAVVDITHKENSNE